jgi:D-alanyl-lipoteichoic acid acyltransferase DltB (MBOAT superfamily)
MLFHSHVFLLLFLPTVLVGYYLFQAHRSIRTWLLVVASLVFYAYWDVRLVPLLVGSVCVNWMFARAFGRHPRRSLVVLGVALNLFVLGVFKYADFFADNLAWFVGFHHQRWSIVLPLAISFFTFQQISYLVDLYRARAPVYRFDQYALYVMFFPQLIAGPIVRHHELIHQFALSPLREGLYERLSRGFTLLIIGIFKKAVIADELAKISDSLFAAASQGLTFAEGWLGAVAFALQIYFDFSGYSDMAIGLGLMFGFVLPLNFNAPYRATSIREFWRRWHMTLSRFLRDYLYISFGGNRRGPWRQAMAVFITFLLGGLWHGAAWTFVVWGALHGIALAVNQLWSRAGLRMPGILAWALTLLFVVVSFVVFRAESFTMAAGMLLAMAGANGWSMAVPGVGGPWLIAAAAALVLFAPTSQRLALEMLVPRWLAAAGIAVVAAYVTLHVGGGENVEFIYFQF